MPTLQLPLLRQWDRTRTLRWSIKSQFCFVFLLSSLFFSFFFLACFFYLHHRTSAALQWSSDIALTTALSAIRLFASYSVCSANRVTAFQGNVHPHYGGIEGIQKRGAQVRV